MMKDKRETKIIPILLADHHTQTLQELANQYTRGNRSKLLRILFENPQFVMLVKELIDETWKKK